VEIPVRVHPKAIRSLEHGALEFEAIPASASWKESGYPHLVRFKLPLAIDDLVLIESR